MLTNGQYNSDSAKLEVLIKSEKQPVVDAANLSTSLSSNSSSSSYSFSSTSSSKSNSNSPPGKSLLTTKSLDYTQQNQPAQQQHQPNQHPQNWSVYSNSSSNPTHYPSSYSSAYNQNELFRHSMHSNQAQYNPHPNHHHTHQQYNNNPSLFYNLNMIQPLSASSPAATGLGSVTAPKLDYANHHSGSSSSTSYSDSYPFYGQFSHPNAASHQMLHQQQSAPVSSHFHIQQSHGTVPSPPAMHAPVNLPFNYNSMYANTNLVQQSSTHSWNSN